jgi:hypothetical protein
MSILKFVVAVTLAALAQTPLQGERRCPGNVPSVPLNVVQGALILVPVSVNGTGPYQFLVDSGAQVSTVDTQLAAQLGLHSSAAAGVSGVASFGRRALVELSQVDIGGHQANNVLAVIDDLAQLHDVDRNIRGIVGEDFLTRFDLLIDNEHRMLCLDDTGTMAAGIKGPHVDLAQPYGMDNDLPFTRPLVISARMEGNAKALLLVIDSGSNVPVIFTDEGLSQITVRPNASSLGRDVSGIQQKFAVLAPQDVVVGQHRMRQVVFVKPLNQIGAVPKTRADGMLPTSLFRQVFVSYRNQFAILTPQ